MDAFLLAGRAAIVFPGGSGRGEDSAPGGGSEVGSRYSGVVDGIGSEGGGGCSRGEVRDGTATKLKLYREPTSIAALRRFAEQAKSFGTAECRCRCHDEPGAGRPGSTLFDGCDRCGCEAT